jgi:hypothetical protein
MIEIGIHPMTHQAQQPKNQRMYEPQAMIQNQPMKTRNNWLAWKTMRKNHPSNNDTTEFVAGNKRPANENTEAMEPDPKRIGIESRALMIRSLDNESKQIAHDINKVDATMMIDSGASRILVRQEHANILNNIIMFGSNAEPVVHLQTAKKGSTLHAIGKGLLHIGNFHLQAYILKNDELDTSLLGLNPMTAQGCSTTFTHDSFHLHHGPNPEPILSGYKQDIQDTWQVQINRTESFTPNADQKDITDSHILTSEMYAQASNLQSIDLTAFYTTTPLSYTLGKQRVSIPRKQRVSAKLQKNTYEPATHAETNRKLLNTTEIRRLLDAMAQSQISTPVKKNGFQK